MGKIKKLAIMLFIIIVCAAIIVIGFKNHNKKGDKEYLRKLFPISQVVDNRILFGYIDKNGKMKIPLSFDYAYDFKDGLALVEVKGKWGFMDANGKLAIKPKYQSGSSFSEGLAAVELGNKYGYIDKLGRMVIEPQFLKLPHDFSEGLACVRVNKKCGYIDKTGKFIIKPTLEYTNRYSYGILNFIVADDSRDTNRDFSEGLAVYSLYDKKKGKRKYGFIDKKGKVVIRAIHDQAGSFSEGLAPVSKYRKGNKCGFIDKDGHAAIDLKYTEVSRFSEGLAVVMDGLNKMKFINRHDETIVEPVIAGDFCLSSTINSRGFSGGRAVICVDDYKGYIDKKGNVLAPEYKIVEDYCGGLAKVALGTKGAFVKYINKKNKVIWQRRLTQKEIEEVNYGDRLD